MDGDGREGGERGNDRGIETGGDGPEPVARSGTGATHRLDLLVLREVDEPLDLHGDAIAIEGRLGEMIDEVSGVFAVATVKRSESDGWRDIGKGNSRHGPIFA